MSIIKLYDCPTCKNDGNSIIIKKGVSTILNSTVRTHFYSYKNRYQTTPVELMANKLRIQTKKPQNLVKKLNFGALYLTILTKNDQLQTSNGVSISVTVHRATPKH